MSEEQAQQLLYQLQTLESYFIEMTQKENTMMKIIREASSAIESIKQINEKPNSESLVPVGMGTYVKTKIVSENKIILNIGAGVAIEKDKDATLNYLESRIKELEVALQETFSQKREIGARLEQGKAEMNKLLQTSNPTKPH